MFIFRTFSPKSAVKVTFDRSMLQNTGRSSADTSIWKKIRHHCSVVISFYEIDEQICPSKRTPADEEEAQPF